MSAIASRTAPKTAALRSAVPAQRPLRRFVVRSQNESDMAPVTLAELEKTVAPSAASVSTPAVAVAAVAVQDSQFLGETQEAINGRAAMLGFVAAVTAEMYTHQSIWSQIAGKIEDFRYVEQPIGAAPLGFAAVVALTTMATLAPKMLENLSLDSRSLGPFTPATEKLHGRIAMLAFLAWVVLENVTGTSLL